MTDRRTTIFAVLLFVAPIVVAWYGLSVAAAAGIVVLLLLLRWLIILSGWVVPEKVSDIELSTISASHFAEKVRWCMDLLGIDYVEKTSGGTLGAFYRGRTVPQLKVKTGAVRSVIGNSPEILRYLYGACLAKDPARAAFLAPTPERLEFEKQLDAYGRMLQVWVYYHLLPNRDLTLRAWGVENPATPAIHRLLLRLLYPVQAALIRFSFRIDDSGYERAVTRIEELLADINANLSDGRESLLGGAERNYTDYAFAAFTGLWLMPPGYGGGKADANRIERDRVPPDMRADVERWVDAYPAAVDYVEALYALRKEGL